MPIPWIFLLSFASVYGDYWISQEQLSFTRRPNKTVHISCKLSGVPLQNTIVHWYQLREGEPIKRIFYGSAKTQKQDKLNSRLETDEKSDGTFYLIINNVIRADEATYYCACWDLTVSHHLRGPVHRCWDSLGPWDSVWSETSLQLRKLEPRKDKMFDADISPKPTIFLPSVAETNLHKAGTYLCLLEKFFPDVIRVYWKEKDGDKILESQEGNTLKTNDTYMKFSWLTVTSESMRKEHRCIVKHENNKKGVDQEISFPPIEKVAVSAEPTPCWHENAVLQLQLTSTSAYYTYLLLLLKSAIHLAMVSFSLARRAATCGNEKKS